MRVDEDVAGYHERSDEAGRLDSASVELVRTREFLAVWLPSAPAGILDVGGGAGIYAFWLAAQGYVVDLVDPMPHHINQARQVSARRSDRCVTPGWGTPRAREPVGRRSKAGGCSGGHPPAGAGPSVLGASPHLLIAGRKPR